MNPSPKEKYVLTFPKDENGNEIKFRFMLSLSKKLQEVQAPLMQALSTLDGIDMLQVGMGFYTLEVIIARTFDADEVIEELKRRLDNVLSGIIRPTLVMPS